MNRLVTAFALLAATIAVSNVQAQTPDKTPEGQPGDFSGLPLDLLPPGARALGLGGAFTAVADDATAALANPAGLTNLTAAEISLHVRDSAADIDFLDPDAYDSAILSRAGNLNKVYSDSSTDVSFASFVLPFERWVISGFYSNQVDFKAVQSAEDVIFDDIFLDEYTNINGVKASIDSFGLSAAFRLSDSWSFGVSAQRSELDLASEDFWEVNHFSDLEFILADPEFFWANGTAEEYFAVVRDRFTHQTIISNSDDDISINAGLLFNPSENWSFGLVYKEGAEFNISTAGTVGAGVGCVGDEADQLVQDCNELLAALGQDFIDDIWSSEAVQTSTRIKVPDVFAVGIAWRPTQTLLLSLDINHVGYSDLTTPRNLTQGFGTDINSDFFRQCANNPDDLSGCMPMADPDIAGLRGPITEAIDDEVEFHFGIENVFVFDSDFFRTLTLRGGGFTVSDHDGYVQLDTDDTVLTLGIGATFGSKDIGARVFQLDLGASFADNVDTVILSGIFRF
jgi:long-subunit fatty acid transport protein